MLGYKWRTRYTVGSNAAGVALYRDRKVVTTFKKVFDVIQEAHQKILHTTDPRENKHMINDDLGYYGVLASVISFFIKTCPVVSLFHAILLLYIWSNF